LIASCGVAALMVMALERKIPERANRGSTDEEPEVSPVMGV